MAREGRERLGNALLIADVGHHPPEDGKSSTVCRRYAQAGLVHEGQQAERLQRDCLAAGVGAGDDHGPVSEALAEPQVDGNRAGTEQRMAGAEQLDGILAQGGSNGVLLCGETRPRQPQVRASERGERGQQRLATSLDRAR